LFYKEAKWKPKPTISSSMHFLHSKEKLNLTLLLSKLLQSLKPTHTKSWTWRKKLLSLRHLNISTRLILSPMSSSI